MQDVPVSKTTQKGMSLNIDDQAFIKRSLDIQNEGIEDYISKTYDLHAALICETVREIVKEQNDRMFREIKEIKTSIESINLRLDGIEGNLDVKEVRIISLEKYMSWESTLIRIALGVCIAVGIVYLLHGKFN